MALAPARPYLGDKQTEIARKPTSPSECRLLGGKREKLTTLRNDAKSQNHTPYRVNRIYRFRNRFSVNFPIEEQFIGCCLVALLVADASAKCDLRGKPIMVGKRGNKSMVKFYRHVITEPSAWTVNDLENDKNWDMTLQDAQIDDLLQALERVKKQGLLSTPE